MTSILLPHPYHRTWWTLMLRGLFALLLGILMFVHPFGSVALFALAIALWALMSGLVQVVRAVHLRGTFRGWWIVLLGGVINIVFGIAALMYYPRLSLTFAVLWVAWWLLAGGLVTLSLVRQERAIAVPWRGTLVLGLLELVAGIGALVYPSVTLAAILALIAAFACVSGIVLLVTAFRLRQRGQTDHQTPFGHKP